MATKLKKKKAIQYKPSQFKPALTMPVAGAHSSLKPRKRIRIHATVMSNLKKKKPTQIKPSRSEPVTVASAASDPPSVEVRKKVLILPNVAILTGLWPGVESQQLVGAAAAAPPARARSSSDLLARRQGSLTRFAEVIFNQSAMSVSTIRSLAPSVAALGADTLESIPKKYTVLSGVGALIADESDIDRVALQSSGLCTVLDNVIVAMVPPLDLAPVTSANPNFWHLQAVKTTAARAKGLDGNNVLVGVLDTGIDPTHPEFAGKTVHYAEFDQNGVQLGSQAHDAGQHGTHVCGLIGGQNAGIAPKASLAVAAVLTIPTPQGLSGSLVQITAGLDWLLTNAFRADPGVDVLSASLGASGYNPYLYQTLTNARNSPGTGLVAAIGNSGQYGINHHGSPGNYDIVLGVGAVDAADNVAPFSDWGTVPQCGGISKPDLSAPGVNVISSVPGGGYMSMSGTSMATPIVAGAAALLIQQNPAFSFNVPSLFGHILGLLRPLTIPANQARGGAGVLDLTNI
jgi:subtilisin family serine protease